MVKTIRTSSAARCGVVSKAVRRAAERLGIGRHELLAILGIDENPATGGEAAFPPHASSDLVIERALLLMRIHCSLDRILGGDEAAIRSWFRSPNCALGEPPIACISRHPQEDGLAEVVAYLETRLALW